MHTRAAGLIILAGVLLAPGMAAAQEGDDSDDKEAAELVATQVRDQGFACDEPATAKPEQSEDGDNVWRLECKNASYKVRLVPDMAASIEQID